MLPFGAGEHAERSVCHSLVSGDNAVGVFLCHGNRFAFFEIMGASVENDIGRTLCELDQTVVAVVYGGHHFAHRVKRRFAAARMLFLERRFVKPESVRPCDKCRFGGFTGNVSVVVNLRVTAKCHIACNTLFILAEIINDRHFVLRQSTRLVGAYDLCTAQRFHCGKAAYHGVAL